MGGACWCNGVWSARVGTGMQTRQSARTQQFRSAGDAGVSLPHAMLAGLPILLGIATLAKARSTVTRQAVKIEKSKSKSDYSSWPTEFLNAGQTIGPCTYPVETQHFVLEGKVVLKEEGAGEKTLEAGDFVTFEKGTKVTWDVKEKFDAHFKVNGPGPLDDGWTRPCA